MKKLIMRYFSPAERSNEGWEKYSMPIGNGYFGASIFGGYDTERIQFTTNTFANDYSKGGVSNFGEFLIHFNSQNVTDYERGLLLDSGVAYSRYVSNGVAINRQAITSYPDKVFAYKIDAQNGSVNFDIELVIPYLGDRSLDDGGRTGDITIEDNTLVMRGTLPSRELIYEARLAVDTDGIVSINDKTLCVKDATVATVYYTLDTSYKLCPEVFMNGCFKALGTDPHERVVACLENAKMLGWDKLYERHIKDYTELIGRVKFDLGGKDDGRGTEELLESYKGGNEELYLEEIYYAYGRHLLVSSSREGTPPASLQGVWTVHDKSPWTCGFWHNINVQMNYWPAFSTNLAETFKAYAEYWNNYKHAAFISAANWIREINPEQYVEGEGECGWIIGTGAWMYQVEGMGKYTHSGPGTGGMTSKMFWDYYDFTRDNEILKNYSYPAIHGMSKFLTKNVKNYDGRYLCAFSASPEQILSGDWVMAHKHQQYWQTVGCAFDQQFIYENALDDIKCSELLGVTDETTETERQQLAYYGPVQIGYSGQIKEYDEEHFYGEIGEANHRHISQLVALTPGSTVTHSTPAWLDAARLTLEMRGDKSTGWALAHRLNAWARVGDGNHAYVLLQNLLKERTHPNLWDVHPPFQIDGNFGATSGMTEMVLQSHEGYVTLLPALPDAWKSISFKGLKARGNFTVDCDYTNGTVSSLQIKSECGGRLKLRYEGFDNVTVMCGGKIIDVVCDGFFAEFETVAGSTYIFSGFKPVKRREIATNFTSDWTTEGVKLRWNGTASKYAIYRAEGNDSCYTLIGETEKCEFIDATHNVNNKARLTYKLVCVDGSYDAAVDGALSTLHPASQLEVDRYNLRFNVINYLKR
ncbi:MAG: glycoside hydrolase family 95 protein [Ruminococcaceae bacterium]|nr:glycoside hydrolase family 95 protein [Oscillospiraceae bacterium]